MTSLSKWLAVIVAVLLLQGLAPMGASAQPDNFGFIPNSGEASVSKVDLVNGKAVARYYTAPRENPAPIQWRTSRIVMDVTGNAWTLNTGADGTNLQGSVVRIQGATDGLASTNNDHANPLSFGKDEAVQVFAVGNPGDIPRTINFDAEGKAWIGFHMAHKKWGYYKQYEYDDTGAEPTFLPTSKSVISTTEWDLAPYNATIDKNGILWFVSYGSSHLRRNPGNTFGATNGVYSFDTNADEADIQDTLVKYGGISSGYGILIDNNPDDVIVYVTILEGGAILNILNTTGGNKTFNPVTVSGMSGGRGMAFDNEGNVWIASSSNNSVSVYRPIPETSQTYGGFGITPVGVGKDASGKMWVVVRNDGNPSGYLRGFYPSNPAFVTNIGLGNRPYAYGDFVVQAPPTYSICGYKDDGFGGAGWIIELLQGGEVIDTAETDEDGAYCFENLPAGVYQVREVLKDGWMQVDCEYGNPLPEELVHNVTLPSENNNGVLLYNFCNERREICADDTIWAAEHKLDEDENLVPGFNRFADQGNWGTYVIYNLGDGEDEDNPAVYPLFAGQHYLAGWLYVYDDGNNLYVRYCVNDVEDLHWDIEGYETTNYGLVEYHLHVVDELEDFDAVRTYNRRTGSGNPIPGQFDFNGYFDPPIGNDGINYCTGWIEIEDAPFGDDDELFIAAHGVIEWCGVVELEEVNE